jgi:hypothetical protein
VSSITTSITTWLRLEPRTRNPDMTAGLQARIHDPLWLLARQWQFGEFQGEDNGSPISARWMGEAAPLTRYYPAAVKTQSAEGRSFDPTATPLEALVEYERIRPRPDRPERLRFAVEAGQQFLRILQTQTLSKDYRALFNEKYAFTPLSTDDRNALDEQSLRFFDLMAPRVPDGRRLYAEMNAALHPAPPKKGALPADLTIATSDVAEVRLAAESWIDWYEEFFHEPSEMNPAWLAERMEYGFSVAAQMRDGERVLVADEHFSGHIDWNDFNITDTASLHAANDPAPPLISSTMIPAPVTFSGMPAARFWEFEDARVDFGSVTAEPEDLARMLLVEFALSYGNDWFVIPLDLPVGSICRTHALTVTNTFGERFVIPSSADANPRFALWKMFQLSPIPPEGKVSGTLFTISPRMWSLLEGKPLPPDTNSSLFLLPPAIGNILESRPVEDVLFLKDEMANLAWAVERVTESAAERPLNRYEQQRYVETPPARQDEIPLYRLATDTPDNWTPLIPVRTHAGLRLRVGKMLRAGNWETVTARGNTLNPEGAPQHGLDIYEEEVPREGIRVTRQYRLARWIDGSTHLWIGRRKTVGRGEGSSGLRFDTV